ncbi:PAP2-domain-containing protein [Calocera cornea HHB12733]|uniref:PAP2-domain-containing protein n=1 Tax=Calocera cornea HHB12733 TaxID=1353952 RepID=A0A165GBT6_9BASI|nr:PAP2-domain-containing protein [Calocera cornea HHB12733]
MARTAPWYLFPFYNANILVGITGTALLILLTRSAHAAWFGAGTVCCTLAAKALKRLLRHPRPRPAGSPRPRTYGMPSTHTSAMAFQSLYLLLCSLSLSLSLSQSEPSASATATAPPPLSSPNIPGARLLLPAAYAAYALGVARSRLWGGHHTLPQVLAGAAWGAVSAVCWWGLWRAWAREAVARPAVRLLSAWGVRLVM